MNIKEVKNVIKGSIFNADLQKQAMDFVDAQETRIAEQSAIIVELEATIRTLRDAQEGGAG